MKKKREGGQTTYPRRNFTEKVPPLLSRILRTPWVLRKDAEQVSKCIGIGFQGSGPHSPTELPMTSWLSLPLFPSKLIPRTSSILASDTAPPTPHHHVDAAAWVLVNYSRSVNYTSERGPSGLKEDTVLFMLHLHTCILDSIFKSDNKSMVPRGGR